MKVHIKDLYSLAAIDKVFLDGVEQKLCVMADTELGAIERYKTDEDGKLLTIGDSACMEELNGVVTLQFRMGWHKDADGDYTYNGRKVP